MLDMPNVDNHGCSLGNQITFIHVILGNGMRDTCADGRLAGRVNAKNGNEIKVVPNGETGFHRNTSLMIASM